MTIVEAVPEGAKKRDYWWTVLLVDPLAVPIARFVADRRLLTADQVTWVSAVLGLPVGVAFAWGSLVHGLAPLVVQRFRVEVVLDEVFDLH